MFDLSILIPARKEEWVNRTVADVLEHTSDRTEVVVVFDGDWPATPLTQHARLTVVHLPQSVGQRAATNLAARLSTARYICKLDAHCSVLPGFDVALLDAAQTLGRECVQIPAQRNLHVYDQVCEPCKFRVDQAPHLPKCPQCQGPLSKSVVWKSRKNTQTKAWRFDSNLQFQYGGPRLNGEFPETMSCLGACWFIDREWFLNDLGGLDESHGSWGQMGTELACKAWLSGGRMVCNPKTEFSHFFRVGGIGFPYQIHGSDQDKAREYSRKLWRSNGWPGQVKPLRWLVEKFSPAGWTKEQIDALPERLGTDTSFVAQRGGSAGGPAVRGAVGVGRMAGAARAGVVYYSDGRASPEILDAAQASIEASGLPIVAVTLEPIAWRASRNIVMEGERGYLQMFRQILAGLEALDTDYAFLCEHDVLYHPSHFDFVPPRDRAYYYNLNVWKVDAETGLAVTYDTKQTSGLCANRQLLVEHYRKRVSRVEKDGFSRRMGFEPGSHRRPERVDDVPSDVWRSAYPNVDIRHGKNLTSSRWSPEQFRDQRNCQNWQEADEIPGWGVTKGRFAEWLASVRRSEVAA